MKKIITIWMIMFCASCQQKQREFISEGDLLWVNFNNSTWLVNGEKIGIGEAGFNNFVSLVKSVPDESIVLFYSFKMIEDIDHSMSFKQQKKYSNYAFPIEKKIKSLEKLFLDKSMSLIAHNLQQKEISDKHTYRYFYDICKHAKRSESTKCKADENDGLIFSNSVSMTVRYRVLLNAIKVKERKAKGADTALKSSDF